MSKKSSFVKIDLKLSSNLKNLKKKVKPLFIADHNNYFQILYLTWLETNYFVYVYFFHFKTMTQIKINKNITTNFFLKF